MSMASSLDALASSLPGVHAIDRPWRRSGSIEAIAVVLALEVKHDAESKLYNVGRRNNAVSLLSPINKSIFQTVRHDVPQA